MTLIVRGRREDPAARLPENTTGLEAHPTTFTSGMWAIIFFISSEAMFFGALFTSYFYLRGRAGGPILTEWGPLGFGDKPTAFIDPLPIIGIGLPTANTIVLLLSSVTMQLAVNAIKRGDRTGLRNWLIPTVIMGAVFVFGQGYEYTKLGFLPRDGIFSGVFFTLTGFHGAHVTGGVLMNSIVLFRTLRGQFTAGRHLAVEAASIYWHFVDVVWIGLFTTIYLIG